MRSFRSWPTRRISATVVIALAVNAVLLAGYLWSRGGQTTHVVIEARGDTFRVELDGRRIADGVFAAPDSGNIVIQIEDTDEVPSLPRPRGLDRVVVTDLDSGDVMLDEDFSSPEQRGGAWRTIGGNVRTRDGVLGTGPQPGVARIELGDRTWRDVRVDVTLKNITTTWIGIRAQEDGSRVEYNVRNFRHLDNLLRLYRGAEETDSLRLPTVESSRSQMIRSMVAMALAPYPWMLLLVPAFALVAIAAQFTPRVSWRRPEIVQDSTIWLVPAALAVFVFVVALRLIYVHGDHMPHVPDELSYLFQADVFTHGRLWAPAPEAVESFELGDPPLLIESGDKWGSLYPFGHPLMLAIGARIGAVWLIPPMIGAACVLLIFAIGRQLYGARVGALAALLFAASPFVLMTASNFMSHNTTAFFLLLSILFLTLPRPELSVRRQIACGMMAGVFFGMIVNTRQLTAAALIVPFGLFILSGLWASDRRIEHARQIGGFVAGGALMLLLYFGYRWITTGDPFVIDPAQGGENSFGFGGGHSVAAGIANEQVQIAFLMLVLHNAPFAVGLVLALLPFALGSRSRWDWFFLVAAIFMMGAYTLYFYHGLMHGPRFWYEAAPLLFLLTARGIDRAAVLASSFAGSIYERFLGERREQQFATVAIAYALVACVALIGTRNWLGDGRGWIADAVPSNAGQLRTFNGVDDRLVRVVEREDLENALVLVEECPQWWCYGNVSWLNSPWLDGDVVFARDLPEYNAALFAAYPERRVFAAEYYGASLRPYGAASGGSDDLDSAPVASSIPVPTAEPEPTPNLAAGRDRDRQRLLDLELVTGLLEQYRAANGEYPISVNLQTLCTYPGDAGCMLESIGAVPRDPDAGRAYLYQSDGVTFTLIASLEETAPLSDCSAASAVNLDGIERPYCVTGR